MVPISDNPVAVHNCSLNAHRAHTAEYVLYGGHLFCTTESQDPVNKTVALTPVKL